MTKSNNTNYQTKNILFINIINYLFQLKASTVVQQLLTCNNGPEGLISDWSSDLSSSHLVLGQANDNISPSVV